MVNRYARKIRNYRRSRSRVVTNFENRTLKAARAGTRLAIAALYLADSSWQRKLDVISESD